MGKSKKKTNPKGENNNKPKNQQGHLESNANSNNKKQQATDSKEDKKKMYPRYQYTPNRIVPLRAGHLVKVSESDKISYFEADDALIHTIHFEVDKKLKSLPILLDYKGNGIFVFGTLWDMVATEELATEYKVPVYWVMIANNGIAYAEAENFHQAEPVYVDARQLPHDWFPMKGPIHMVLQDYSVVYWGHQFKEYQHDIMYNHFERQQFLEQEQEEELLMEHDQQFVTLPQAEDELWLMYKQQAANVWFAEEIDFRQDSIDWETLMPEEQAFFKGIIAFFAASDGIVCDNLATNFYNEVKNPSARAFYAMQIAMETIHSEVYALTIDTLIKDPMEKNKLFHALHNQAGVHAKGKWARKYCNQDLSFPERLVAFACVEGIMFSASFCGIFYFKKKGKLHGVTFSNELISRDEGLHTDFACVLYRRLKHKLPSRIIRKIVEEALQTEFLFIDEILPQDLLGMNARLMKQYVSFIADRLLIELNALEANRYTNPFDWMELISMQGKTNFFEKRVGDYQRAQIMSKATAQEIIPRGNDSDHEVQLPPDCGNLKFTYDF